MNDYNIIQSGFLAIDKPASITSFDVIRKLKKILKISKIGHAGTLDPFATGILPIATGEYTKLIEFLSNNDKSYEFTMKFGTATDTMDIEGKIIQINEKMPSLEEITKALPKFTGNMTQIPPKYSAIKIEGQRAYDLARQGREFEIPERKVTIYDLRIINYDNDKKEATFYTKVSKGTYIRSLAVDLAEYLGASCHLNYLKRKEFGKITEQDMISLEKLENMVNNNEPINEKFLPVLSILDDIPVFEIDENELKRIRQGQFLNKILTIRDNSNLLLHYKNQVMGVAKFINGQIKPVKNLNL